MWDDADVMVAGGSESAITPLGIAGFATVGRFRQVLTTGRRKPRALTTKTATGLSWARFRHFGARRTRTRQGARCKIYAEVVGYGMSGDAITSPHRPKMGRAAFAPCARALKRSGLSPDDISYINAHGTSTPVGDEIELRAVEKLFGGASGDLAMSSTKSAIGHLLGAAGSVEAIFSVLAIRDNVLPPTLNLDNPSLETDINLVPNQAQEKNVTAVLSNSFGFGGTTPRWFSKHSSKRGVSRVLKFLKLLLERPVHFMVGAGVLFSLLWRGKLGLAFGTGPHDSARQIMIARGQSLENVTRELAASGFCEARWFFGL